MFDHKDNIQGAGDDSKHDVIQIDSDDSANSIDVMEVSDAEQSDRSDMEAVSNAGAGAAGQAPALAYSSAKDFEGLSQRLMKPEPDYPVKASSHFVWEIKDWNTARKENKLVSPQFDCAGFKWNILMFPRGNNDSVSLYMEPHPQPDASGEIDPKWYVCAQFAFDMWNPSHPESHHANASSHRFNKNDTDWGFSTFISLSDLSSTYKVNQSHPILENNALNITGFVRVIDDSKTGVLWSNLVDYDSKSSTGYVGLSNQGATCYLNSLVQSYFTSRIFKNLVYEIPTDDQTSSERGKNSKAVALALQRIFYLLQSSNDCVSTLELTKSFGWDTNDAFTQHDVQELNRVLMDKLETAMKGTKIEKSLNDIFVGKMKSYIKCVNVDYESSREEDFWDIQLNVKGFQNLEQSFQNYIEIEMLDGENKYQAGDEYGYQDAKKGVVFKSFPPVLHLQLKRFEYDFMVDDLVKIDDFYEFPDQIDLSPYLDDDLDESIKNENWNYKLHGVLVHQGSISNGHYYAMIKPEAHDDLWMRFEDDKVWKVTPTKVFKENFGAPDLSPAQIRSLSRMEQNEYIIRRATSAYMLVYYRETELDTILPDSIASIPKHVSEQIERERQQNALMERKKQEALHYIHVKIVTPTNFTYFNGFDLYPDPSKPKEYDPEIYDSRAYPETVMVRKDASFAKFVHLVAQKLGYAETSAADVVAVDLDTAPEAEGEDVTDAKYPFSLAVIKQRNNKTNRPDTLISEDVFGEKVIDVFSKCFRKKYDEMAFFVLEHNKELKSVPGPEMKIAPELFDFDNVSQAIATSSTQVDVKIGSNDVVLFIKYFDLVTDQVRGLTFLNVSKDSVVSSLTGEINKLLGLENVELTYFEEVSRLKIEPIDPSMTIEKNELGNGDVLAVQIASVEDAASEGRFGDIQNYYKFLLTRLHIQVKPCKASEEEEDSDFVAEDENGKENERESSVLADTAEGKEIQLAKEISKSFDLWVSTTYTYQELAACIAKNINGGVDAQYLRIFLVNNHGTRFPLSSSMSLSQIFTKQVAVSSISQFEYEMLNITLKEYENMKAIKISWLDSVVQFHSLELLVPKSSTVANLVEKVVHKLNIPETKWSGLLVWASKDDKYEDLLKFDKSIAELNDQLDLYCGYFPAEVEILVSHDMFKRYKEPETKDGSDIEDAVLRSELQKAQEFSKSLNIIPAFHFQKSTSYTHSIPFVFAVFPEEPFEETRERLKKKLGLGKQAFDKVRIALADINGKGKYLENVKDEWSLFDEMSKFESHVSLALDHRDRNPRRQNQYDKGITIG